MRSVGNRARNVVRRSSRMGRLSRRSSLFVVLLTLGASPSWTGTANALPDYDPQEIGEDFSCPNTVQAQMELHGVPRVDGYPIAEFTVEIDARHVKYHGSYPDACEFSDFVAPVPEFAWAIAGRPSGSTAALTGTTGLTPHLPLDQPGSFVVRLTTCPSGCTIQPPGDHVPVTVATQTIDIPVEALEEARLGPETMPEVVLSHAPGRTTPDNNCSSGAGVIASQWFAVRQIWTPKDYRLVEGVVRHSRVSRKDSPFNHGSQDTNYYIVPDPKYSGILFDSFSVAPELEVEWERSSIPERYRPTFGDRASIFGHWIYDCAHESHPEIHPPVGVAVHRPRPIRIPETQTFAEFGGQSAGANVYVPGIISDIFFSTDGGDLVDCSIDTGLKNADLLPPNVVGDTTTCIPPPSLDRVFEFDIFLPRNPQKIMAEAGISVPPVPLYIEPSAPPWAPAGPVPSVTVRSESGVTYLHVSIDLRGYTGSTYEYRIASGWVLPADDNWGLQRWKLRFNGMDVSDDGDGATRGDGDWRLWVNTNNATNEGFADQEWRQIIDYDVHGVEDFGGRPWETGAATSDRSLGPDLLRYPSSEFQTIPGPRDYLILFHTTGFEGDTLTDDDAGTVHTRLKGLGRSYSVANQCSDSVQVEGVIYSGCVRYTAHFEVIQGSPIGPAVLSTAARARADQYILSCPGSSEYDDVGVCGGSASVEILAVSIEQPAFLPLDLHLLPTDKPISFDTIRPYRPGRRENSLTEISIADFYQVVVQTMETDPARVHRMLDSLREHYDELIAGSDLADDAYADLSIVRVSLPPSLWAQHFSDIAFPPLPPETPKARFTGSATLAAARTEIHLGSISLHCGAIRTPNQLRVTWDDHRFDLDLIVTSSCADDPASTGAPPAGFDTITGVGFGRYNGLPGAVIEWTLVDRGERGLADSASIRIVGGAGDGTEVLKARGTISRGNLQATAK